MNERTEKVLDGFFIQLTRIFCNFSSCARHFVGIRRAISFLQSQNQNTCNDGGDDFDNWELER